jgi:hypothetical protein
MKNNLTINQVDAVIKLIERRYLLAERFPEKYSQLNNNLQDICKTLEISDAEIKEMQDKIENKEFSMDETPEERKAKTIVKNYNIHGTNVHLVKPSLSGAIIGFFKNITVVDFMVLNKKAIVSLILLLIILNFGNYAISQMGFLPNLDVDVRNAFFITSGYAVSMVLIGLILPLIVQTFLNYIVLGFGIWCVTYLFMMLDFNTTVSMRGSTRIWIELAIIVGLPILYGMFISKLRKKYVFKIALKK